MLKVSPHDLQMKSPLPEHYVDAAEQSLQTFHIQN